MSGSGVASSIAPGNWEHAVQTSSALESLPSDVTTLVFKNMPEGSSRRDFCDLLDVVGLEGQYNFLYIPASFKTWKFFGYAFVNFERHETAARCFGLFQNDTLRLGMTVQWCEEHQGLSAHIERYRSSPIMHEDIDDVFKPILLKDGQRVPFPPPTKPVRPPKNMPPPHV